MALLDQPVPGQGRLEVSPSTPPAIYQNDLSAYYRDPDTVKRLLPFLRVPNEAIGGRSFPCVLPGHAEHKATILLGDNGVHVLACWCGPRPEIFLFSDVFSAETGGQVHPLSPFHRALWGRRLLVRAGVIALAPVSLPPLPDSASPLTRKVYEGFRELLGVRWYRVPGEAVPFSWRFTSGWCGVSERQAGEGIHDLMRWDIIQAVGQIRTRTRLVTSFLPGPGRATRVPPAPSPYYPLLVVSMSQDMKTCSKT